MKINNRQIDAFVRAPSEDVRAALLYGPDEGLVRERALGLVTAIAENPGDPFRVVELSAAQVEQDTAILGDEAAAIAMMGGRRAIRIRDANDRLGSVLAGFLEVPRGDAFVVLEAGELAPRSALRRTFEEADNGAALPCYADDGAILIDFIRDTLGKLKVEADHEVLLFIESVCGSDRQVTRRELEKLALYAGPNGGPLDLEMVKACIGDTSAMTLDDIAYAAGNGDQVRLDRALQRYFTEGGSAIPALRVVAGHLGRLQRVVAAVGSGRSVNESIAALRPPVFFKRRDAFQRQSMRWQLDRLQTAQKIILHSELKCKISGMPNQTICSRALMQVAAAARQTKR